MTRNTPFFILLLLALHLSLMSCTAFRPVQTSESERYYEKPNDEESYRKKEPKAEDALRQGVVDYAQQFVGTGYKAAGKKPDGFDCSGFTGYVMGHFGIKLSASSKYQEGDGKMIPVEEVLPGDLMFFRRDKSSTVFHVAIVISNDQDGLFVVHSTSGRGVVVDNIKKSSYWSGKYATACRVIKG